jgi:Ssp1 endopeptidase immunity protein Rap1a
MAVLESANMKPTILFLLALLSFALCGNAAAHATSGEEMLKKCKKIPDTASFDAGFCAGFVDAVLDTLNMWEASDVFEKRSHDKDVRFCLPEEVTNGQILLVFVKYLEDHPEELHKPANLLLIEALRKAFPCERQ